MKILGLLCLLGFVVPALAARTSDDNITLKEARERKSQVRNVDYHLFFELSPNASGFKGKALIKAELARTDLSLSIDSMVRTIELLKVNGKVLSNYPKRKGSFDIPAKALSPNVEIEITYSNDYAIHAGGLIRSKDPTDRSEYIYTDFEPYYAHNLFPCFDQPDLKARFRVTVSAPSNWKVIQNELPESSSMEGEKTLTVFKTTLPISTYLFFLGAGPFHQWTDNFEGLPIHLYARKSLMKYVDAENIFKTTKAGLKFFNNYFGYPYPFSKYGQLFIPEFAWGGMENPGAVTLNEKNIFRGPMPASMYAKRENLILHEMAHMWFGDLVTMEWWNDLWLNESFATYLASVAQERALDSKATWISFMTTKTWGYWQDQLVTTHPIETEVPDVRTARGNFDGITYAKGASALKQLHFFVGEDGFREGLRSYFKTFAFSNTQRNDFVGSIARASKVDLDEWTKKWLQTAGPNRLVVDLTCDNDKVKNAVLKQQKSVSGALSPHKTKIGFFEADDGEMELEEVFDVTVTDGEAQIKEAVGEDCPDFVFPNLEDQDYAIYSLDKNSIAKASDALIGLKDPLTRTMLWATLYQMVRDGELRGLDYFAIAIKALGHEEDDLLVGSLLGRHSVLKRVYELYLNSDERSSIASRFEDVLWNRVEKDGVGSSLQMAFFDFLLTIAGTTGSQEKLYNMLAKNALPKGIVLDQDRRWSIILNLSYHGYKGALQLRDEEVKRDPSTQGKRMAFAVTSAWPEKKSKERVWKQFLDGKLTYSEFSEAAHYFNNGDYPDLMTAFRDDFFRKLTSMDWKSHDDIVDIYFENLFPIGLCSKQVAEQSRKRLNEARNLTSLARRSWKEAQDELDRCVRIRTP